MKRKTHHKYRTLVIAKDLHTGEVCKLENVFSSIREMKLEVYYRYKVKKIQLVAPDLYQGVGDRYEVSVFVEFIY